MKSFSIATAALMAVTAGTTLAEDNCNVPMVGQHSRKTVRGMIAARGQRLHRLKIDDGCYEARLTDTEGRCLEVVIDPATLEILEIETRHPHLRAPAQADGKLKENRFNRQRPFSLTLHLSTINQRRLP